MIFRFRITYEDHEEVYRDIDIRPTQSFEELHLAIQQAIAFDNSKSAKFYMSDDYWRKEAEITIVNAGEKKIKTDGTKRKSISEFVIAPHQKFVYVFDPEKEWTFNMELIKILPDDKKEYPVCIKTSGIAPKQYKVVNLPPPEEDEDKKSKLEPDDYIAEIAGQEVVDGKDDSDDDTAVVPTPEEMDVEEPGESEDNPKDEEEGESSDGLTFDFDDEDIV
jgi:hypothetical protein